MRVFGRKIFKSVIFIALPLLILLAAIFFFSRSSTPEFEPVPNPNGYSDFVAAGQMIDDSPDFESANLLQHLQKYVPEHHEALQRARAGLAKSCSVPTEYSMNYAQRWLPTLAGEKRIAQVFCAEATLAQLENRPADAAKISLECFKFGYAMEHGGLLIDCLVAVACQHIASTSLEKVANHLSPQQCRIAIAELQTMEKTREPFAKIKERERKYSRCIGGLYGYFNSLVKMVRTKSLDPFKREFQQAEAKVQIQQARVLHLQTSLAARAFEMEKGRKPKSFQELVPEYLPSIPIDPQTKTNLVYQF